MWVFFLRAKEVDAEIVNFFSLSASQQPVVSSQSGAKQRGLGGMLRIGVRCAKDFHELGKQAGREGASEHCF